MGWHALWRLVGVGLVAVYPVGCARVSQSSGTDPVTMAADSGAPMPGTNGPVTMAADSRAPMSGSPATSPVIPADAGQPSASPPPMPADAATPAPAADGGANTASNLTMQDDAGAATDPCTTQMLPGNQAALDGVTFFMLAFNRGSVSGGTLHLSAGRGSPIVTLGTLRHKFTDYSGPVELVGPASPQSACTEEIRATINVSIASEDTSLLADSWPVTVRMLSSERFVLEYEADVANLDNAVREGLAADPHVQGLDRMRFDFDFEHGGRAVLFKRGQSAAQGAVWFELALSCLPPAPADARKCGDPNNLDPTSDQLTPVLCVADAQATNAPFLYGRGGAGKSIAAFALGTLDAPLATGRKGFFETNTQRTNWAYTEIRRCSSIQAMPVCMQSSTPTSCVTCTDPGEWLRWCDGFP